MEHINENQLYEYIAGRLPEAKSRWVRQHITECDDCETRYRDAIVFWNRLGQWHVDTSGHQIADRIVALIANDKPNHREIQAKTISFRRSLTAWFRVAAAIIIAIGGGHLLGRYSLSRNAPDSTLSRDEPRYVAALGFEWSSELTWTAMEEDAVSNEVNQ